MANRNRITVQAKLDRMKAVGVTHIEAHDTDILELVLGSAECLKHGGTYPRAASEVEKMQMLRESAKVFRAELQRRGLRCGMFTMNLFSSEQDWNYGNYGSEKDAVRQLAIDRTKVGIEVAVDILNAHVYVYWVGTNGTDGRFSAFHPRRIQKTRSAIVAILSWAHSTYGKRLLPFAFEP